MTALKNESSLASIIPKKRSAKSQKPNILLIHPVFSSTGKKTLPVGLCYLAAYLRNKINNLDLEIFDAHILNSSLSQIQRKILQRKWEIIGISYWTIQAENSFTISSFIKKHTDSFLVHGGVHATVCPEEAIKYTDCIVLHEGEETFFELVQAVLNGRKGFEDIQGIMYKKDGKIITTSPRTFISNLDELPFPAFDLLPLELYDSPMHVTGGRRLPLIGSRGCPYNCTFCTSPLFWKRKLRTRTPLNIVTEIAENKSHYGVHQIHFWDDNMIINKNWMQELCNLLISKKMKINWCGLSRAEHIVKHYNLLPLMKKAGCVGIEIGIESFSDQTAQMINKGEKVKDMMRAAIFMKKAGIVPLYTHMIFTPGETISSYHEKEGFLKSIELKRFSSDSNLGQATTPHRKTVFEKEASSLGVVLCKELGHYNHQRVNFIPFSLLNDIPIKNFKGEFMPYVLESLRLITTGISLNPKEIRAYIITTLLLLKYINGKNTLKQLTDKIIKAFHFPKENTMQYCALAIATLARKNLIKSDCNIKN